jgi:hypothetical protein
LFRSFGVWITDFAGNAIRGSRCESALKREIRIANTIGNGAG